MKNRKASEWMDIKELSPLKFMPYMAELFWNITGRDLKGLSDFMGWVGLGSYYHWKLSQLGQLSTCPHLQGQPVPDGPIARPSRRPHPCRLPKLGPQQLEPLEGIRTEANPPLVKAGTHPSPTGVGNQPPQAEVGNKLPQGARLTCPQRGKERVMAGRGMNGPSGGLEGKQVSPKALPTQSGPHRPGGRLSAKFMITWLVKSLLPATSPQRLFRPITQESRLEH